MAKQSWKPGNMVYPVPSVMVSVADGRGNSNIITVAWTGTVCSDPAMVYISVRPERHSYGMLKETGEFIINLTSKELVGAADYCGVRSGRDVDKWKEMGLTKKMGTTVSVPYIDEAPVCIECKVTKVEELGTHHMFLAKVTAVLADERWMDEKGKFHLDQCGLVAYSHGEYREVGSLIGTFGYSVRKAKKKKG